MIKILEKLRATSSTNEKIQILEQSKSADFALFAKLVYDKIEYKYYITNAQLNYNKAGSQSMDPVALGAALNPLFTRQKTGNAAIEYTQNLIDSLNADSQELLRCILDRDCHSGINVKTIEKVYGSIFFELPYMRCSLVDKLPNISYPAILQLKADGTYRTAIVKNNEVSFYSRSGEEYFHPLVAKELKQMPDGAYIGELIVRNLGGDSADVRYASNGALNSLNPPEDVDFFVWDFLTLDELESGHSSKKYKNRFETLKSALKEKWKKQEVGILDRVNAIQSIEVKNYEEAREITNKWIKNGYEGSILKDYNAPFENKTSKYQIKLKNEAEIDVRCIGFTEGKGKFAKTFGAIIFESDDKMLAGQCSGLSDAIRSEISQNKENYINKILTIKGNDLTRAKNSEIFGIMHPQFVQFRNDKSETDTIDRVKNIFLKF